MALRELIAKNRNDFSTAPKPPNPPPPPPAIFIPAPVSNVSTPVLLPKSSEIAIAKPKSSLTQIEINERNVIEQCGVVPNFRPCLPVAEASARLLNCCKAKNLPGGCHELCRYDITQKEVKRFLGGKNAFEILNFGFQNF